MVNSIVFTDLINPTDQKWDGGKTPSLLVQKQILLIRYLLICAITKND